MVATSPTLYPEPIEVASPPGKGLHGYYRRKNGWVVTAPTTSSMRSDFEYMGHTFLPQYGEFRNDAKSSNRYNENDARGVGWDPTVEPWRLIFQRGGAKEFPIDQIIAFRWHVNPPYREVEFPQLRGVTIFDLPCPECDRFYSSTNEREAARQLRVHLTSQTSDAHKYTPTDLRELGKEWGINFETARVRRTVGSEVVPSLEAAEQEAPELTPPAPVDVVERMRRVRAARGKKKGVAPR